MPPAGSAATNSLADIYVARALDPLIELASAVARDFVKRPEHHTRASAEETSLLSEFRILPGKHPEWPDAAQRSFATTKLLARFSGAFTAVRLSALQYVQGASSLGTPVARLAFIDSADLLRETAQPLEGAALSAVAQAHTAMLQRAVTVVGSSRMAETFGARDAAVDDNHDGVYSPGFGYLCESMSQTLALDRPLNQPSMSSLQRVARHGAATMAGVLDPSFADADDDRVAEVVRSATAWAAALGEVVSRLDVARAWTEPAYRSRLFPLERDVMPPHPSGEVSLEGTIRTASARFPGGGGGGGGLGFSTQTVAGEICCSTGDLICGANTNGQCDISDDCPTLTTILT